MTASVKILANFDPTTGLGGGELSIDAQGDLFVTAGDGGDGYTGGTTGDGTLWEIANTATGYATTPSVLLSFNGTDGSAPVGGLLFDSAGDLFGTANYGGANDAGTLFELAKTSTGYASTPGYEISFNGTTAYGPFGGLVADANGDLFGTTYADGYDGGPDGDGTVFEIVKTGSTYAAAPTVLASFDGADGQEPEAGLVADAQGNLFGTTAFGGAYGEGTVFEIANTATGYASTPIVLFSFDGTDGGLPQFPLIIDAKGDLFGTTGAGGTGYIGGESGYGTVFEIANTATGYASTPTTLVAFDGTDSGDPSGGLVEDAAGDLFGVTANGPNGAGDNGTVFEVENTATGYASTATTLLAMNSSTGLDPDGTLVVDADGDLFGDTSSGGTNGDGAVFELTNTGAFILPVSITGTQANQAASDQAPIAPFTSVTIDDPNSGQTETVAVTLSDTANGTFVDPNAATDGATIADGVWLATGTLAAVTADLQALQFQPTQTDVTYGQTIVTGFSIAVSDSDGQTASDTKTSVVATAMAPTTPVVSFDGPNGSLPNSGLIENAAGDLIGMTGAGGSTYSSGYTGDGTVFEIQLTGTGYASTPTTIASFTGLNGAGPLGGLIEDANGDLFGTVNQGGTFFSTSNLGYGTVFEIANTATGYAGTITTLVNFDNTDGRLPHSTLLMDAAGDLFGTTGSTVFEIQNSATGYASTPTTLFTFNGTDGSGPDAGLVADAAGDLFGITQTGGANNDGTVFEVEKTGSSYATTPTVLVQFNLTDGRWPSGGLAIDANGDLFGTTTGGGTNGDGTVFEIPNTGTGYASTPTVLVNFDGTDGAVPESSLVFDANGDLLGTTRDGGAFGLFGGGTVFEVQNTGSGYVSTPIVLVSLQQAEGDGSSASLFVGPDGDVFGTAALGGAYDDGTVFEVGSTGVTMAPPAISGTVGGQLVSDQATIDPFASVGITDPNPGQLETATVTLSTQVNGSLVDPNAATDGGMEVDGVWTFVGSPFAVTQDLQGLMFQPTPIQGPLGQTVTTGFTIAVTDTAGQMASDNTTTVIADNSVPTTVIANFDPATGLGAGELSIDAQGDLFVTAGDGGEGYTGGTTGDGTLWEIANTTTGYATTPSVLLSFNGTNGSAPVGPLLFDSAGDLFGTANYGGANDAGTLYELAKTNSGYASTPGYEISFNGTTAYGPFGGLIADANGDLFGTTYADGYDSGPDGDGTVFEIVKTGSTYAATPTLLASFDGADGQEPEAGLVADAQGNLFGTTAFGGAYGNGEVFEIANTATGYASTPIVLFSFDGTDGGLPQFPLIIDAKGDLFGTTGAGGTGYIGGESGDGTVFEIANTATGYASTATTLLAFDGTDSSNPSGGLVEDAAGDLFGVTANGPNGAGNNGTVFEIANTATGYASTATTLLSLGGNLGSDPDGTLVSDADGDLFGVTTAGGPNGDGVVFEIPASFIALPTLPDGTLHLRLQQGQSVSLDQLSLNPAVAPSGVINWVVLDGPGTATANGIVSINTLEVAGGVLALGGGTLLTDPVTIDADGDITGYGTVTGATINNGTVTAVGGSLDLTGSIAGAGTLVIDNAATLELANAVGGQQLVQFDTTTVSGTGVLLLDDPVQFGGTIAAHVAGDSIVVNPVDAMLTAGTLDISGHILTLLGSIVGGGAGPIGTVTFANAISANSFTVVDNAVELACFAAGTQLATPAGPVAVERLAVGDKVTTLLGGSGRIVWIGTRTVACARHPRPEAVWPVRIRKDAFGPDVPSQDLWLSPDHAVFVEDVLIPIRHLINGTTIVQEKRNSVHYFHVELQAHDVLLAEGLPCESFLDTGNRTDFDNAGPVMRMHPELAVRAWDALGCAPLVVYGAELAAAHKRLAARAAFLGRAVAA